MSEILEFKALAVHHTLHANSIWSYVFKPKLEVWVCISTFSLITRRMKLHLTHLGELLYVFILLKVMFTARFHTSMIAVVNGLADYH
jgi:hypothetical protein